MYAAIRGLVNDADDEDADEGTVPAAILRDLFAVNAQAPHTQRAQLLGLLKLYTEAIVPLARNVWMRDRLRIAPAGPIAWDTLIRSTPKALPDRVGYEHLLPTTTVWLCLSTARPCRL